MQVLSKIVLESIWVSELRNPKSFFEVFFRFWNFGHPKSFFDVFGVSEFQTMKIIGNRKWRKSIWVSEGSDKVFGFLIWTLQYHKK